MITDKTWPLDCTLYTESYLLTQPSDWPTWLLSRSRVCFSRRLKHTRQPLIPGLWLVPTNGKIKIRDKKSSRVVFRGPRQGSQIGVPDRVPCLGFFSSHFFISWNLILIIDLCTIHLGIFFIHLLYNTLVNSIDWSDSLAYFNVSIFSNIFRVFS